MDVYRKAHYDLECIKQLLANPKTRFITARSKRDAFSLGYVSIDDMVDRVQLLKANEIDKTMTSDRNPTLWQDVYKTCDDDVQLYIKLQVSHDNIGVIISFHLA